MSKISPLVSVCVPSFNSAPYLHSAFNSLLSQTYENIELVFVDDCSSDDSWEIACDFEPILKDRFPKVKMLRNERNLGTLLSMNGAFKHMTGEFASYLDADDYLFPAKIEENVNFLMNDPSFGAVHSEFSGVYENIYRVEDHFWQANFRFIEIPQGWIFDLLIARNYICSATLMVRKNLWDRCYTFDIFKSRDYRMGDYPGHLNLSRLARIGYIKKTLANYRIRAVSMSHSPETGEKAALERAILRVQQDARLGVLRPLPEKTQTNELNTKLIQQPMIFSPSGLAGTPTTVE